MGYQYYELADGRPAGYGVDAQCDAEDCAEKVWRGFDHLCGEEPHVRGYDPEKWGCGNYYCRTHEMDGHQCPRPQCAQHSYDTDGWCGEVRGHELPHRDPDTGEEYILTELEH